MVMLAALCVAGVGLSSPAAAQRAHEVGSGDTMSALARRYRVDVWDLALANDMQPDSTLRAGQQLTIPPRGVTYVRPGQTLSHIARAHDCSVEALQRVNGLRGDTRLRAGSRLDLPGFAPKTSDRGTGSALRGGASWGEALREYGPPEQPGVVTLQGRTGAAIVEMVDAQGRVRLLGVRTLAELMRRDMDEAAGSVHPRLAVLIAKISDRFGGREIRLVSGFREARGFTRRTSRHTQGRAVDLQVVGVPPRAVFEYCRSLAQTGCGLYPRSTFVHVDVRENNAQWVDWSGHGRRARYGTLQRPYRRGEARRQDRPRLGRQVTRPAEVPLIFSVVNKHNAVVRMVDERVNEAPLDEELFEDDATEPEQNAEPDQLAHPDPPSRA
jgi:uncharacterized protein YcbK (DUF882 family)/LysM repeat protein